MGNEEDSTDRHEQPTMDFVRPAAPASITARYEILGEAGRGGMGIVYKARDRETGEVVALKVLKPEIAADEKALERFKNELRLARKITHRNVCRTHDFYRAPDGTAYISMEFVEGESLRAILARFGGLGFRKAGEIAVQICAALREAHREGVVHRDLKPENIMLARDGAIKVMDFGVARLVDAGGTLTGQITGTPAYMSPEQAAGKPDVDHRADIYSLGLILYELYTGAPAVRAETPVALVMKQIHDTPVSPREVESSLPAHIEKAILRCLEKDPARRFQSVDELEAALGEQPLPEPSAEGEPVPAPHLSRWGRADSILLVLGLLGLLIFLAWRNSVFPDSNFVLEVDEVTARREAKDLVQRLGHPVPGDVEIRTELEYRPQQHVLDLLGPFSFRGYYPHGRSLQGVLADFTETGEYPVSGFPLYWKTEFIGPLEKPFPRFLIPVGMFPERYVLLDRRGKLKEFHFGEGSGLVLGNYPPPPIEGRRDMARKAVEDVCGPIPARMILVESPGGQGGASYSATWKPYNLFGGLWVFAEVSLLQERVTSLKCSPYVEPDYYRLVKLVLLATRGFWVLVVGLLMLRALPRLFILFGAGQCYRSPLLLKRLPWAVLLGMTGAWVLAPAFFASPPWLPARLLGGLASSGLFLVGLVAVEHHLRRRAPAAVASYVLGLRGRFRDPAVCLGLVRGALAGLVLAGLETLLAYLGLASMLLIKPRLFFSAVLDSTPVGYALASFSPALFVVSSACFHALFLGVVLLGLGWVDSFAAYRRAQKLTTLLALNVIPAYVWLAIAGLPLHVGVFQGGLGVLLYPAVWALALGWLLLRYDLLTVVVAVATATLWSLNYPLLQILREIGNGAHWGIFAGWAALIVLATLVAFQAQLRQYLKQE